MEHFLENGINYKEFNEENIRLILDHLLENMSWEIQEIKISHNERQNWWADITFIGDENSDDLNDIYEKINGSGIFRCTDLRYGCIRVTPYD